MRGTVVRACGLLAVFAVVCLGLLALGAGEDVALLAGQGAFALALVLLIARG
jgi:hypothetical protein